VIATQPPSEADARDQLAARGESTIGRVPSAAGDAVSSSRSANAADAPAPPEPFGRMGILGSGSEGPANLCVARRQRCPRIASSSRLDLARNTHARDLLYFHHGLLGFEKKFSCALGDNRLDQGDARLTIFRFEDSVHGGPRRRGYGVF
jgi:hypothetical protein